MSFVSSLSKVFEGEEIAYEPLKSVGEYTIKHSPENIGGEFIKLFEQLL